MNHVSRYLDRYAEVEAELSNDFIEKLGPPFQHCVVMPCYDESESAIVRLSEHTCADKTLLIVVINQAVSVDSSDNCSNAELFAALCPPETTEQHRNIYLSKQGRLRLMVIDRFTPGLKIPDKLGVGLARKIGFDIACTLWLKKRIDSVLVHSTDADAHLPSNYFSLSNSDATAAGAYFFEFLHTRANNAVSIATRQYEQSIKYYRRALEWAGSPYAFCALGSSMAINVEAYAKVRGFPKRAGGEDFYLLNKICKITELRFAPQIRVIIESRTSHRVPFGTGPAVDSILNNDGMFESYDARIFDKLRQLLAWAKVKMPRVILNNNTPYTPSMNTTNSDPNLSLSDLDRECQLGLDSIGFSRFYLHAQKQCSNDAQLMKHFHTWFDAFKTLKFVHYLQSNFFPPQPLEKCLEDFSVMQDRAVFSE